MEKGRNYNLYKIKLYLEVSCFQNNKLTENLTLLFL